MLGRQPLFMLRKGVGEEFKVMGVLYSEQAKMHQQILGNPWNASDRTWKCRETKKDVSIMIQDWSSFTNFKIIGSPEYYPLP